MQELLKRRRYSGLNRNAEAVLAQSCEAVPQPTEWRRIGNQIDAAFAFARAIHAFFDGIMAGSFTIRQSKTILAQFSEAGRALLPLATKRERQPSYLSIASDFESFVCSVGVQHVQHDAELWRVARVAQGNDAIFISSPW